MKRSFLVLQNQKGTTTRVIPFMREDLEVIYRHDLRRMELVRDTKELTEEGIEFKTVGTISKSAPLEKTLLKDSWGQISHVERVEDTQTDIKEREENSREFTFFVRWTAGIQMTALLLILAIGWWLHRQEEPETQVVKVFRQEELKELVKPPTVTPTREKIQPTPKQAHVNPKKQPKVTPKKVTVQSKKAVHTKNERAGNDINRMGALSALGGMDQNSHGPGGLSSKSSKSGGYGFDSSRARGGSNRGLLGKGLVQGGIGNGENLSGYGGYGTKGKGEGQAGYGFMKMAGQSGGYFLPLSEESTVEGGLHPDQINAVIRRNQGQVTYCYERGLQVKPQLSGRVSVNFVIAPSGRVSAANVGHSSLASREVESCIIQKLRAWQFPRPKGNVAVKVSYPFLLKRLSQG